MEVEDLKYNLTKIKPKTAGLVPKIADKSGNSEQTVRRHLNGKGFYYRMLKTYRSAMKIIASETEIA